MNKPYFLVDAHLDLSMNAMDWNRDLRLPIQQIRDREKMLKDFPDRGNSVVNFEELRRGNIGLVVATQIARYVAPDNPLTGWHSPQQAWAHTQAQLAWYREMEQIGELRQIKNLKELNEHLSLWESGKETRIGYILSLEGADSIVEIPYVEKAFNYGLRAIGPAHYGPGRYAQGTNATGGLGHSGRALLREMEQFNMILDATHLCNESFWEALDHFNGPVWASHHNCRALVNHNRQLSDDMINELIRRGAVIGAVLDAWMMVPDWQRGISIPYEMSCDLEKVINHIDHICQIAGNANHVAIGSDLDGGFGKEQCPYDIETIADLQNFPQLLHKRGYQEQDILKITSGNWVSFLRKNWK